MERIVTSPADSWVKGDAGRVGHRFANFGAALGNILEACKLPKTGWTMKSFQTWEAKAWEAELVRSNGEEVKVSWSPEDVGLTVLIQTKEAKI